MKTKHVYSAGAIYIDNERWILINPTPLPRKEWMTSSQQRWLVVPSDPSENKEAITGEYIYLPERVIVCDCSHVTIVYPTEPKSIFVQVCDEHNNEIAQSDANAGYDRLLEDIGAEPSEDAMLQGEGHE